MSQEAYWKTCWGSVSKEEISVSGKEILYVGFLEVVTIANFFLLFVFLFLFLGGDICTFCARLDCLIASMRSWVVT